MTPHKSNEESDEEIIPSSCPTMSFSIYSDNSDIQKGKKNLNKNPLFEMSSSRKKSAKPVSKLTEKSKNILKKKRLGIIDELSQSHSQSFSGNWTSPPTKSTGKKTFRATSGKFDEGNNRKKEKTFLSESGINEIIDVTPQKQSSRRKQIFNSDNSDIDKSVFLGSASEALENVHKSKKNSPYEENKRNCKSLPNIMHFNSTSVQQLVNEEIRLGQSKESSSECKQMTIKINTRLSGLPEKEISSNSNHNNMICESELMFSEDLFSKTNTTTNTQGCCVLIEGSGTKKNLVLSSVSSIKPRDQNISRASPSKYKPNTNNNTLEKKRGIDSEKKVKSGNLGETILDHSKVNGIYSSEDEDIFKNKITNRFRADIGDFSMEKGETYEHECMKDNSEEKESNHNRRCNTRIFSPRKGEISEQVGTKEDSQLSEIERNGRCSARISSPRKSKDYNQKNSEEDLKRKKRNEYGKNESFSSPKRGKTCEHDGTKEDSQPTQFKKIEFRASVLSPRKDEISEQDNSKANLRKKTKNSNGEKSESFSSPKNNEIPEKDVTKDDSKETKIKCNQRRSSRIDSLSKDLAKQKQMEESDSDENFDPLTSDDSIIDKDYVPNPEEAASSSEENDLDDLPGIEDFSILKQRKLTIEDCDLVQKEKYLSRSFEKFINVASKDKRFTADEVSHMRNKVANFFQIDRTLFQKLLALDIKIDWKLSYYHSSLQFLFNGSFYNMDKSHLNLKTPKKGRFAGDENESIIIRWRQFCQLYEFNVKKDFVGFLPKAPGSKHHPLSKKEKLKFAQFLAKDLPDRMLHSVYFRFVEIFKYYNKGRFSPDEEDLMLFIHKNMSAKDRIYALLSTLLHRSRYTIYKRMTILLQRNNVASDCPSTKDPTPSEEETTSSVHKNLELLKTTISRLSGSEDVKDWDKYLRKPKRWRKFANFCSMSPQEAKLLYLCALRIKALPLKRSTQYCLCLRQSIVNGVKKHKWKKWKNINWKILSEELSDVGPVYLYYVFRKCVKKHVAEEHWSKLSKCIEILDCKSLDQKC